jgi:hypothetical protein
MRCLHCGSEVSLLQKLSDAQFCSAEHRQHFYDDQQRLILQRLQMSAARFARYRRGTAAATAPTPTITVPVEESAPAKIAAFCIQQLPEASPGTWSLLMLGAVELAGKAIHPASRSGRLTSNSAPLQPGLFDFPWAKYNSGLHSFDPIAPLPDIDRLMASLLVPGIRDWFALSAGRLVAVRGPHAIQLPLWPSRRRRGNCCACCPT